MRRVLIDAVGASLETRPCATYFKSMILAAPHINENSVIISDIHKSDALTTQAIVRKV